MVQIWFPVVERELAPDEAATDKGAFPVAFAFSTPLCSFWRIIWNDGWYINKKERKQWNFPRNFRHILQGWCNNNQNVLSSCFFGLNCVEPFSFLIKSDLTLDKNLRPCLRNWQRQFLQPPLSRVFGGARWLLGKNQDGGQNKICWNPSTSFAER